MRLAILILLCLAAACAPNLEQSSAVTMQPTDKTDSKLPAIDNEMLPNLGPAPELQNEIWLNIDHPLRLADLRGQVVLLDMWTFG